jgi:hypothetical protein
VRAHFAYMKSAFSSLPKIRLAPLPLSYVTRQVSHTLLTIG